MKSTSRRSFTKADLKPVGFRVKIGGKVKNVFVDHVHAFRTNSSRIFTTIDGEVIIKFLYIECDYSQASVSLRFILAIRISAVVARVIRRIDAASNS
jgi:hypothetical protein